MKPREIDIVIFESLGWKYIPPEPQSKGMSFIVYPKNLPRWEKGKDVVHIDNIPNYSLDLNAMREAEKLFNQPIYIQKHAWNNYKSALRLITGEHEVHASAAQKAEAYYKTLKLWKE